MSEFISTDKQTHDIDSSRGQYTYLAEFLSNKGASSTVFSCLSRLFETTQVLEQRLKEAEKVIGFYEEHSKVSGDFDEVPTVTIFSVTGLNHKNSGSGEIHGTYKRYGKRARAYFEKYGEKEGVK